MNRLQKFYQWICQAEEAIAGAFLVAILGLVFAAAVGRSVGYPLSWAMDMSTFLFAWTVFFSADIAMRRDKHVSVDVLVSKLPVKIQHFLKIVNYLIINAFLLLLIIYGSYLTYTTRFRTFQGIPGFSYSWATLSMPVGGLLLLISTLGRTRKLILDRPQRSYAPGEAKEERL